MVFLATTDAGRTRAFYEGLLGLTLVYEDNFAIVFDLEGTEIRIQKVKTLTPQPFTVMGWAVKSIARTVGNLCADGIAFEHFAKLNQDKMGIWDAPSGAKIAWFKDPDGNTLSLTEHAPS